MGKNAIRTVRFRRRREGRTNYRKRILLLKSRIPRLVIRKTNKHIYAQIIDFDMKGDKVLVSANSKELTKYDWKFAANTSTAYLVGYLLGKKAQNAKVKDAIPDLGLHPTVKGSKLFAVAKGALDSGLSVRISEEAAPSEARLNGQHIIDYFKSKSKDNAGENQFKAYEKNKIKIEDMTKLMESVKSKLDGLVK